MNPVARLARRARLLISRESAERSMDDEMRYHIECEARERLARGEDEITAWRAARLTFGGLDRFKEEGRDARGTRLIEDLRMDAHYALRVLRRSPAFTIASLITLALGIGATTAIFSVVRGVLLRPLPYAEPERLAVLWERNVPRNRDENVVSVPNFEAWRARSRAFDAMAGMVPAPLTMTGAGDAQRVRGAEVSSSYFEMLGGRPMVGRVFVDGEGDHAPANVIVLSHRFWLEHFRGERAAVGRAVILDGSPRTIIGVMPPEFEPPRIGWMLNPEFWIPFTATASNRTWGRFLIVMGRLRKGTTIDQARADQQRIGAALANEDKADAEWGTSVKGLTEQIIGDVRTQLWVLMVAVGLLLAMAIANVANLTLAQVRRREHELAVRGALGASRPRLVRQLLTQSALLGLAGGTAGVLAAIWGVHLLIGLLPSDAPRAGSIRIDGVVLAMAAAASAIAVIFFGVWPTLMATKDRIAGALGESGHRGASDRLGGGTLIVAEVALAVGVSVIAGLAMRSFLSLRSVDLGFDPRGVVVMRIALPGQRYQSNAQQLAFFESMLGATRALPGVRSAGVINIRPFGGEGPATTITAEGKSFDDVASAQVSDVRVADGDYFRTLRIALVSGRTFDAQDGAGAPPRAVVSRSLARQLPLPPSRAPHGTDPQRSSLRRAVARAHTGLRARDGAHARHRHRRDDGHLQR
ncbi:MAG: ABC transporter permease, partial [Gemmatimonadota bacterium]|nr:ABC transporter permease [Gemmatimonadota bacterium]